MADRRKRFTEQMIERLRPPPRGRPELKDALTPALVLRVTDRGTKTFSAVYQVAGEGGAASLRWQLDPGPWPRVELDRASRDPRWRCPTA